MRSAIRYDQYVLAYADILGFSERVSAKVGVSRTNLGHLKDDLLGMRKDLRTRVATKTGGLSAKFFSDSVILTLGGSDYEPDRVIALCSVIARFQAKLAPRGYFLRGAITAGSLYEDKSLIFGPAMVRAVQLEKELSIWPRIILDPMSVLQHHASSLARQDQEGIYFLDYLSMGNTIKLAATNRIRPSRLNVRGSNTPPQDKFTAYFARHKAAIEKALKTNDERTYTKFCWLATYHNRKVQEFAAETGPITPPQEGRAFPELVVEPPPFSRSSR